MNAACVIDDLEVGGVEKGLLTIARALPGGVRLTVYTVFAEGALAGRFRELGVPVRDLGMTRRNAAPRTARLVRALRSDGARAVLGVRVGGRIVGALAGRLAGARVTMRWDTLVGSEGRRWLRLERAATRWAHRYAACSDAVAESVRRAYGVPATRMTVSVCPAETWDPGDLPPREDIRGRLGLPAGCPVVCTVANLNWRKDYPTLLRAAAIVLRRAPEARFVFVGDGPERGELERMKESLGLGDAARFLGFRGDVPEVLKASDVYAVSSVVEGRSVALQEAMQAGLPCVATAVGGIAELVEDGGTGLLVPSRDPAALAEAVLRLLRDEDLRRRLGEAGRRRARSVGGVAAAVKQFLESIGVAQ